MHLTVTHLQVLLLLCLLRGACGRAAALQLLLSWPRSASHQTHDHCPQKHLQTGNNLSLRRQLVCRQQQ